MTGQRIGYIRVYTVEQNSERQLDSIDLDRVFTDHMSGDAADRPALAECILYARDGDTVFVHSLDRLGRNLVHLRSTVDAITAKGASVEFVKERLVFTRDNTNPLSNLMMNILGSFAEFELSMIRARQREGIAKAKARGVYTGRRAAFTPEQAQVVRDRALAGESKTELAREYGVSRKTIYEYLRAA